MMSIKRKIKNIRNVKKSRMVLYLFMIGLVGFTALPLIYVASTAFKPYDELFIFPPRFFVRRPVLTNFMDMFVSLDETVVPFIRYLFNSIFVTLSVLVLTILVCSIGAFSLSKHKPKGSKTLFSIVIATLMLAPPVTQIPTFMIIKGLGMFNTYWALIVPVIAVPYNFFLMKQFTDQFPDQILEAARIDGAKEITIFSRIVMPALKPAWATLMLLSFTAIWNNGQTSILYTADQTLKTLPVLLSTVGVGLGRAGALAAITFTMTLPTVLLFILLQSKVIETMAYSGIKS